MNFTDTVCYEQHLCSMLEQTNHSHWILEVNWINQIISVTTGLAGFCSGTLLSVHRATTCWCTKPNLESLILNRRESRTAEQHRWVLQIFNNTVHTNGGSLYIDFGHVLHGQVVNLSAGWLHRVNLHWCDAINSIPHFGIYSLQRSQHLPFRDQDEETTLKNNM